MIRAITPYLIYIVALLLAACGSLPKQDRQAITPPLQVVKPGAPADSPNMVVQRARSMLGRPYRYGGRSPRGFDCSGLVYYSFAQKVPRSSRAQFRASQAVKRRRLRPGDLVFFKLNWSKVSHVGIYIGRQQFIHAPSGGKHVMKSSLNEPYWRKRFVRGGRFPHIFKEL